MFPGIKDRITQLASVSRDSAMPMATGIGLKPSDNAAPMAIGAMRFVEAVCDVSSDNIRAVTQNTATKAHSDG